jgi:hypothetical protein
LINNGLDAAARFHIVQSFVPVFIKQVTDAKALVKDIDINVVGTLDLA